MVANNSESIWGSTRLTLRGQSANQKECAYDVAFQIWLMQIWRPMLSHLHHPARLFSSCGYRHGVVSDFKTSATIQLVNVADMLENEFKYVMFPIIICLTLQL